MLYALSLKIDAFHKPSETWHVHETKRGLRAVSRKHALNKALAIATKMPCYADREGSPDWDVTANATFLPEAL